ncbi:MAG TPA: lamin tail domain-containing protein [Xanthomonadales bacterium]|nr:lamin tail domain-containing protein [Xanthomonadales bacterium]
MFKTALKTFFILLLTICIPIPAYASVVINEFLVDPESDQWVEVFNNGNESVDIGGWFIDDDGGSQKFTIPSGITLNPQSFKVFESSYFNLNRSSADKIRLLNGATLIDQYEYSTSSGANYSYGRTSDGGPSWAIFNNPTKESSNNASSPLPTPTSTPQPTPTPTKVPTPTKMPTPTKTPTAAKSTSGSNITNASSTVGIPTIKSSSQTSKTATSAKPVKLSGVPTSILGVGTKLKEPKAKKNPDKELLVDSANQNNFRYIALAVGLISLACGILMFLKTRNKNTQ